VNLLEVHAVVNRRILTANLRLVHAGLLVNILVLMLKFSCKNVTYAVQTAFQSFSYSYHTMFYYYRLLHHAGSTQIHTQDIKHKKDKLIILKKLKRKTRKKIQITLTKHKITS